MFIKGDPNYEFAVYFLIFDLLVSLFGEFPADPPLPTGGRIAADAIPPIAPPTANYLVLALRPNPDEFFEAVVAIVEAGFEFIGFFLLGAKAT